MKNVRQADIGEYLPLISLLLLCLEGLDGDRPWLEKWWGVCVFYTQVILQTLGFISAFQALPTSYNLGTTSPCVLPASKRTIYLTL